MFDLVGSRRELLNNSPFKHWNMNVMYKDQFDSKVTNNYAFSH